MVNHFSFRMENFRYLLAAIAALTLLMSVVSSVNPSYFAGLNAFADNEDDGEDDDNSGSSANDEGEHEDDDNEASDDHEENKLEQPLGNHSKASLEVDEDTELGVEIEDGDLEDGIYGVVFSCDNPDISKEFPDSLNVEDGQGEFEADLTLSNGTYTGCDVDVGGLSAAFPSFNIVPNEQDDEEDDQDENEASDDDNETSDNHNHNGHSSNGVNGSDNEDEDDDDNSAEGSHNGASSKDKANERKERIVSTTSGADIHERHRSQNAASPGEFEPGWNYTLAANGTAITSAGNETGDKADATVEIDLAVWKSTGAIVLLDVLDGTVEIDNQTYTVVLGYALYTVHHDAFKIGALVVADDGSVYKLKLSGSATDEEAEFTTESGSIALTFEGNNGPSNSRVGDWELTLEGTVTPG